VGLAIPFPVFRLKHPKQCASCSPVDPAAAEQISENRPLSWRSGRLACAITPPGSLASVSSQSRAQIPFGKLCLFLCTCRSLSLADKNTPRQRALFRAKMQTLLLHFAAVPLKLVCLLFRLILSAIGLFCTADFWMIRPFPRSCELRQNVSPGVFRSSVNHTGNGELGHREFSWGVGPPCTTISPCLDHCTGRFGTGHFCHCTPSHSFVFRQRSGLHRLHGNDPLFSDGACGPLFREARSTMPPQHTCPR
jgi:hypothetical protein